MARKSPCCQFSGEDFQILTESTPAVVRHFFHISRNIVSHAIEEPGVRKEQGKKPELTVMIETGQIKRDGQSFVRLVFEDDGQGIDVDALRNKLRKNGFEKEASEASDGDVMQCVFKDNFSTRENTDELSGRGVGLSATKFEIDKLGGTIRVESERNVYTRFIMEIPLIWD